MAAVTVPVSDGTGRRHGGARRSGARWRYPVLVLTGVYFLVPLYAAFHFALQDDANKFSVRPFTGILSQQGFTTALRLSGRLAVTATIITLVLMVPTTVYLHLRAPRLRRLFDGITLLPIVIPPVVLIVGVLQVAPVWLKASPNLLGLEYAVLAMPFAYRSLDAGLAAIDVKTLFEASRSLGGRSSDTLLRVILPNIRAALLSATVLTVALVLGEYTMATLALFQTIPVWIVNFQQSDGHVSVAVSLLALVVTWLVLLAISSLDRRWTTRRRTIETDDTPAPAGLIGEGAPA